MATKVRQASGIDKPKLFALIWRGWFVGVSVVFAPILLIAGVTGDRPRELLIAALMVPVIAAVQGVLVGGIVLLGLRIWSPRE